MAEKDDLYEVPELDDAQAKANEADQLDGPPIDAEDEHPDEVDE